MIDKELAYVVIKKFSGHLWYLTDETVALAFFDSNVSFEIKSKMVQKINSFEADDDDDDDNNIQKRLHEKPENIIKTYKSLDISDFITRHSKKIL